MGLFYFPRFDIKKYTPLFLVLISVVSVFEFLVYNSSILSTLIIRRMFYTPPCLDIAYYDYIVQNGPTYFMDSIAFKLGALRGDESTRCNNGMFSDAFMNLGYVGCLVFPLLFAYLSKIFDYITTGLERSLTFFAAFIFMLTLESSYLTTSMLTHGIFLLGVTLYFFPKEDSSMISMQANNL